MAEFPVPLDNLITYVKALHPGDGPLENVSDAFTVSARLDEPSDALIGYFVDQARKSGASSSQIGTEHLLLGVLFADGPVTGAFSALGLTPQRGEQLITAEIAAFQASR